MKNTQTHEQSPLAQWTLRALGGVYLIGVALFALLPGFRQSPVVDPEPIVEPAFFVDQPELARDLDDIKASGVLRILTRNNGSSYLVLRGEEYGFEYELARRFARTLDVKLEVVLADSQYSLVSMLNKGLGDLAAAPLVPTEELQGSAALSVPYNEVEQVLVVPREYAHLYRRDEDLRGRMVAVRRWSNHQNLLVGLRERNINVGMVLLPPDFSTEEILDMVADGTYGAALASSHVARACLTHRPELAISFPLSGSQAVSWATRTNSPDLMTALNEFLQSHYQREANEEPQVSKTYTRLYHKYFVDEKQIRSRNDDPFRLARTGRLSEYDEKIQAISAEYSFDWRLIASLIMQESRFNPTAESWAGAVGLMQVLPSTARRSAEELKDADLNLKIGTKYLRGLYNVYRYLPYEDRLSFALAAYNAGQGHVDDARMLAITLGKNPNQWQGSVDTCMLLLLKPEYHRQARYGYVRGTETVDYVRQVLRRFDLFRDVTERDGATTPTVDEQETALDTVDR